MLEIAHAILQNGEGFQERATDAFQEIVSELYDGYLSDARRSVEVVAEPIVRTRVGSLENHALGDIQDWRDVDQKIAEDCKRPFVPLMRPLVVRRPACLRLTLWRELM